MLTPYLNFNGNTAEVIDYYEKVFDATDKQVMTFKGMPNMPKEMENWVMHGRIVIQGSPLMFSDAMSTDPVTLGDNVTLMITAKEASDIERWFGRLSEGGEVWQELQTTFFSPLYGSLKDKYGTIWQFNLESEHGQ